MKTIISICAAICLAVGAVATYFLARPKVLRQADWRKTTGTVNNGWRVVSSKAVELKNKLVENPAPMDSEAQSA